MERSVGVSARGVGRSVVVNDGAGVWRVVAVIAGASEDVTWNDKTKSGRFRSFGRVGLIYLPAVVASGSGSVTMLSAIATSLSTFVTLCKPLAVDSAYVGKDSKSLSSVQDNHISVLYSFCVTI